MVKKRAGEPQVAETRKKRCEDTTGGQADLLPDIGSQSPIDKIHAGGVTRRTDRQASALPPPDSSASIESGARATTGRGRRRRAAPGGGNFDSASDSDKDGRGGPSRDGDGLRSTRPATRRIPQSADKSAWDFDDRAREQLRIAPEHNMREIMRDRCMQKTLKYLGTKNTKPMSSEDLAREENRLLQAMSLDNNFGPVPDHILKRVDELNESKFDQELAALTRYHSPTWATVDALRSNLTTILESGNVHCRYVRIWDAPYCDFELFPIAHAEWACTFRVLVKDDIPIRADLVPESMLQEAGWRWQVDLGFWGRYQRGTTELTRNNIYRVQITGEIEWIWKPFDEDTDLLLNEKGYCQADARLEYESSGTEDDQSRLSP